MALRLKERKDFCGGAAHGNEIKTQITFFLDGGPIDLENFKKPTPFNELVVTESSIVFDPDDSTTQIAEHGSEHIFSKNGLQIIQTVLWNCDADITTCYLAMHLPAKTITNSYYLDINFKIVKDIKFGKKYKDVKKVVVFGNESGVKTELRLDEYPTEPYNNNGEFFITDNGGREYNKCYFFVSNGGKVKAGTIWKSKANYKFDINQ